MSSQDIIEKKVYRKYSQDDLQLDSPEWGNLKKYINEIELLLGGSDTLDLELQQEPPRIIGGEIFDPKGWVGTYQDLVRVIPDKIDIDSYRKMTKDVEKWIQIFGASTADAVFPYSPDIALDARNIYPTYSRALLGFTEQLLSGRLPVEVVREKSRGQELVGPPDFRGIIMEQASRSPDLISRRTRFTFDTPANHLLYEFHHRISKHLGSLISNYSHLPSRMSQLKRHHQTFIHQDIPDEIKESRLRPNLEDPEVLTRLREESTGIMAEIVDLWEAYLQVRGTRLNPTSRFATAIKPISKVYELWCLSLILSILIEEYGSWRGNHSHRVPSKFRFETGRVILYFDTSVSSMSKYVAAEEGFGKRESGRPDFLLEIDGDVHWLADAKFQNLENLDISGIGRFLGYILDFIDLDNPSQTALLGIGSRSSIETIDVEGVTVNKVTLAPPDDEGQVDLGVLQDLLVS